MIQIPKKHLKSIEYNGLSGRLLHLPSKKKKTIIFLGGLHASQERLYGITTWLNRYGEVYAPDLPGFGGMDSFYKIGLKPTADNYADYLHHFFAVHHLDKDLILVGNSLGFQFFTTMLSRYPSDKDKFSKAIGLVAFADADNFNLPRSKRIFLWFITTLGKTKLGGAFFRYIVFNRVGLFIMLRTFEKFKAKMKSEDAEHRKEILDMETHLWLVNDPRTHGATAKDMFKRNLTPLFPSPIDLGMVNIVTENDQYVDNKKVEKSFNRIFDSYSAYPLKLKVHAPSVIGDADEIDKMMPSQVKRLLSR